VQVAARGLTFDVRVAGPDAARGTVLLLHGFPQHSGMWDGVTPALHAAGYRTVAPDQRGYSPGARPPEVDAYDLAELSADALAILDALAVHGPVHLVGHDWGAMVGWRLAAEHADRLATWTAVSVPHPGAMARALLTDSDQRSRSKYIVLFRIAGKAEDVLLADGGSKLRRIFTGSGLSPEGVASFVDPLLEPGALTGALNWYRALPRTGYRVKSTTVPTTFVWSDGDLAIGAKAARGCGRYVDADYRFVVLEGVTHWIADQCPDELAQAILARVDA